MKKINFFILFILFLNGFISLTSYSQSQAEMNEESIVNYRKVNEELSSIYLKITIEYKSDTTFIKNFKAAQKAWLVYRDKAIREKYPEREAGYYGTIQPVCEYDYLTQLTNERIKTIKVWLDGIEEGDTCIGSVKVK